MPDDRPPLKQLTLKVAIQETKPRVWRRVVIPSFYSLRHLHETIQTVFDWEERHLHEFRIGRRRIGCKADWEEEAHAIEEESDISLGSLNLKLKQKFSYVYDLGDNWLHSVRVEAIDEFQVKRHPGQLIRCIGGKRRAPIEDSGGPWGWARVIEATNDPSHPDHRDLMEWAGEAVDPDELDLDAVDQRLAIPWHERPLGQSSRLTSPER